MQALWDHFPIILIAAFGGMAFNFVNLWEDSHKAKADRVPKDGLYILFFFFWPVTGGILAWVHLLEGSTLKPFLALSVGVGAPATLKALASAAVKVPDTPSKAEQ